MMKRFNSLKPDSIVVEDYISPNKIIILRNNFIYNEKEESWYYDEYKIIRPDITKEQILNLQGWINAAKEIESPKDSSLSVKYNTLMNILKEDLTDEQYLEIITKLKEKNGEDI